MLPLSLVWRNSVELRVAAVGPNGLYGITPGGKVVAVDPDTGAQRWESAGTFLTTRLVCQGTRLFAYRAEHGLVMLDDQGSSATETLVVSFRATTEASISAPAVFSRMVYGAVNSGLFAYHQDEGLRAVLLLGQVRPYSVAAVSQGEVVLIDGRANLSRYRLVGDTMQLVWEGQPHGINAGQIERSFIFAGNYLVLGVDNHTVAYRLDNGQIAWRLANVPAQAFRAARGVLYAAWNGAALWAINLADGSVLWQRQYMHDPSQQRQYGIDLFGEHVLFGGMLAINPDRAACMAVRASDGAFEWLSRSAVAQWAAGIPLVSGQRIFVYGAAHTGAFSPLAAAPRVQPEHITVTPRPLRGRSAQFEQGQITVNLPVAARVSLALYREEQGAAAPLVNQAQWSAGPHQVTWNPRPPVGFTDENQFGYLLADVTESATGATYTHALLMPVNSFPDILWHWARANIEIMAYHRYVSGFPDQLFRPDNLVTRAESCTIIAKTLGLEGPTPGFRSKLTDLGSHWARNYIWALEERGIVGGFAEPGGTFTFRPDLNMTRAQEARILVNAYAIAAAPPGFTTRFRDVVNHWAEADIKALEAAGYVAGFQEPDGSFTFRPDQSLTRAELATMVVRIRSYER